MNEYADLERKAAELQMSPTLNKLAKFARSMPIDVKSPADLNAALCTITVDLVRALDADRVHFERDEDNAMLHALLLIALQVVFDGQFGAGLEPATMQ